MRKLNLSLAAVLSAAVVFAACGGSGGVTTTLNPNPGGNAASSATMISAGDAPMSSVLAALVTVSAVNFTNSSGSVAMLSQPVQIELTHLGGIRAPLAMHALPEGTYTGISLTVSAAQITYIDSNGNPVVAQATIPSAAATQTITLNPPLAVTDTGATDVRFDFDLQQSLDLTGSTVTFTPTLGAIVARVKGESADQQRIHINGKVSATDATAQTITLTQTDTGVSFTLKVSSSTQFDDGLTLASLQAGDAIRTLDLLNNDGSLTALMVEDADGGNAEGQKGRVDGGIVTAVNRDSQNNLTSFTMIIRESLHPLNLGQPLTVEVTSSTLFKSNLRAKAAGLPGFDQSQIIAGEGVWVGGTSVQASKPTILALEIRPAQVNPYGLTSLAPQALPGGGFSITLLLDANSNFAKFAGLTSIVADTNALTIFDGTTLSAASVGNLGVGTPLVARGFLYTGTSGDVTNAPVVYTTHLHEEAH